MKTLLCSFLCLASIALVAAPANDNFTNRISLVSTGSVSTTGSNVGATHEACDPVVFTGGNTHSVWWTWTSPASGPVTINTFGSSYDTVLGVFTGSELCSLSVIGTNDDSSGLQSKVTFSSIGGVAYQIMVGGWGGASGAIKLAITASSGGCVYSISPASKSFPYTATNGTVAVTTTTGCIWSAISNDPFLTVISGSTGTNSGTVAYTVTANTLLTNRVGTITIAGFTFTVTQTAAPSCTYALSPTTSHVTASPITNTVSMIAGPTCPWTATPNASWLTIASGGSGTGNGTITYVVATNSTVNSRTGTITAAGKTLTVNQDGTITCSFSIAPTTAPFTAAGGTSNIVLTTTTGCAWTASSPVTWVTFSTTNGTGSATVTYTVGANAVTQPRSTVLTVAGKSFTVTQAAAACAFSLTSSSLSVPAVGASSTVGVTTTTGCSWTAVANDPSITITAGSSGSGSGTVSFTVSANLNTVARTNTMTIAGLTFTVNQAAAACIYSIAPSNAHLTESAQSASITVTAGTGCAWTAVANTGFITINSGTPGSGSGTVGYSVSANVTSSSRTGTITVAGFTFTITQDGTAPCLYSILPTSCACAATSSSSSIAITANAGCAWSVSSSDPTWLTFTPASGTGNSNVVYSITANPSSIPRSATLTIAGQIFTVNQAGIACAFTVNPLTATYTYVGGSGTATVTTSPGCNWSATDDSTWITITAGASGVGNGTVSYTVAASTVFTNRIGRLTIAGKTLVVTQTGAPCAQSISPVSASIAAGGGTGVITITSNDESCAWTAVTNATWISVSAGSGFGSDPVTYTVLGTTSQSTRTGTIVITGGNTFNISQSGDTSFPVVSISSPSTGSTVSNFVTVTAIATDNVAISRVEFYLDQSTLIGTSTGPVYSVPFNTSTASNGAHLLFAKAFDLAGNSAVSSPSTSITVANSTSCTYTISPLSGFATTLGGTGLVTVTTGAACAWTATNNVSWLSITAGSSGTGSGPVSYLVATNTALTSRTGTLTIAGRTFSIQQSGDTALPNVSVNSPVNGSVVSGTITITATATDNTGVASVQFYYDTTNFISTDTSSPYTASFDTTSVADGIHSFIAKAFDAAGNTRTSFAIQVTVNNSPYVGNCLLSLRVGGGQNTAVDTVFPETLAIRTNDSSLVMAGGFKGTVTFGGSTFISVIGSKDIFIAKYSSNGVPAWSKQFGGNITDTATGVAIDQSNGDVVVTGYFDGPVNFGGGILTNAGASDIFLARYSSAGVYQFAKRFGNTGSDLAKTVAIDSTGKILLIGQYNGTLVLDSITLTNHGSTDGFLAQFNSSGTAIWAKSFGSTGADEVSGMAVDSSDNVLVSGSSSAAIDLGGGSINGNGQRDIFAVKHSSAGTFVWQKGYGGTGDDVAFGGLAVDTSDNVVFTGIFTGILNMGSGSMTNTGTYDTFLVSLDSSGTTSWTRQFSSFDPTFTGAFPVGIITDSVGNITITGSVIGAVDFGKGYLSGASQDLYIAKYSPSNTCLWTKRIGGGNPDQGYSLVTDASDNTYNCGLFWGPVNFGCGTIQSSGLSDAYLLKLGL